MDGDESLAAGVEHFRLLIDRHFGFAGRLRGVVLQLDTGRDIPLPVPGVVGAADDLPPIQASIVAVLRATKEPLKASTIARKADRACNSNFRSHLSQLVALGRVKMVKSKADAPRYQLAA